MKKQETWKTAYAAIIAKMLGAGLDREEIADRLSVDVDFIEQFLGVDWRERAKCGRAEAPRKV